MAAKVRVVVTGLKSIDRKLALLPYRVQGKVVRPAMRAGLRILAAVVRAEVPVDRGLTRAAVKVRAARRRRRGVIEMEVRVLAEGPLKKTSAKTGETVFYPAIVEYGGAHHPPDPFMHRAYSRGGGPARRATLAELRAGVGREIKSL